MKNYRFIWAFVCTIAVILSAGQAFAATPANDSCANATPIENVTNQAFDTTGATHDGSESYSRGNNIWYCYTATCTGSVTVNITANVPHWDTMLAVYDGCQCPATAARRGDKYNDDYIYNTWVSQVTFDATCGNQYLIEVGHFDLNTSGTGKITITCSGTPCGASNDNCANAIEVSNVVDKAFDTTSATFDGPGSCNIHHSPNIWYKYTATCSGQAVISICGNFDTLLAVYSGTSCSNLALLGCNDYPASSPNCNSPYIYHSELTLNTTAGINYWIEVSGFKQTDKGQGILNITCNGQAEQASDLGDAPDSTNHSSTLMRTYDHLATAHFPTVYEGNAIKGPIHFQPKEVAYLGSVVTYEDEADQGYDEDGINNIIPSQLNVNADRDGGDDGVIMTLDPFLGNTLGMNHCQLAAFDYKVNVIDPNVDMYVNVWFDWNRDGDWEDSGLTDINLNCTSCNTGGIVKEWAVQNQLLYGLKKGLNTITTPGFLAWHPATGDQKVWMRITLSDQPWKGGSGAAGSGPAAGYEYGETEDYYFTPKTTCTACEDLNRDGTVDELDLFTYMLDWLNSCVD